MQADRNLSGTRITTIDQADIYGSYMAEEVLGKALKGTAIRDKIEIVTKCNMLHQLAGMLWHGLNIMTPRERIL